MALMSFVLFNVINNLFQVKCQYEIFCWIKWPLVMVMYERIRNLREDKDISQRVLASKLGMSQTGYSKYETGENDIPTTILKKLAIIHNTSADYILELTDEVEPYRRKGK
jgi:DNA-binding XRE family transcriptional regulator